MIVFTLLNDKVYENGDDNIHDFNDDDDDDEVQWSWWWLMIIMVFKSVIILQN